MRAAQVHNFGGVEELQIETGVKKPEWKKGHILINVHAVSLSPSDYRLLSGDTDFIKHPGKNGWPLTPGGDIAGTVIACDPKDPLYHVGDKVVATWTMFGMGGLAEYCLVKRQFVTPMPEGITYIQGAALANSAGHAYAAVRAAKIKCASRVLVLGGSGGLGTMVLQLLHNAGVETIITTSTNRTLCKELGATTVIDYTKEDWMTHPSVTETKLDAVIDCAEGQATWKKAKKLNLVKSGWKGGRWIAMVPKTWQLDIHTFWDMCGMMLPMLGKWLGNLLSSAWNPRWIMPMGAVDGASNVQVLDEFAAGKTRVIIDQRGPFPFTTKGIRDAYELHWSRHAVGKVVIDLQRLDDIASGTNTSSTGDDTSYLDTDATPTLTSDTSTSY